MENAFEKKVFGFIREHQMIEEQDYVIVGVSGGADSVCLLFVLHKLREQLPFSLAAAHVEHGIRGGASLADAAFVGGLCGRLGIPFEMKRVDARAKAAAEKLSEEEAGRLLRYGFFEELAERETGSGGRKARIAVAHNADDQAETILWNLVRGSGLKGLTGMRPVREKIIRPLLSCNRKEIEDYLRERGIDWRTDATNLQTGYTRNRLRLKVLPLLERECNAGAARHIVMAGEKLAKAEQYLCAQAEAAYRQCVLSRPSEKKGAKVILDRKRFLEKEEIIQEYILRFALEESGAGLKNITSGHIEDIRKIAGMQGRKELDLPGGIKAGAEGDRLFLGLGNAGESDSAGGASGGIFMNLQENIDIFVPSGIKIGNIAIKFSIEPWKKQIIPEKKYTKWFDYDTIENKLQVRNRLPGDFLTVTEEGGHKKLKDYLIDEKVPHEKRGQLLLLAEGHHILWAVGYRISEAYKISDKTKRILKVQVMEDA